MTTSEYESSSSDSDDASSVTSSAGSTSVSSDSDNSSTDSSPSYDSDHSSASSASSSSSVSPSATSPASPLSLVKAEVKKSEGKHVNNLRSSLELPRKMEPQTKGDLRRVSLTLDVVQAEKLSKRSASLDKGAPSMQPWHEMEVEQIVKLTGGVTDVVKGDVAGSKGLSSSAATSKQNAGEVNRLTPPKKHSEIVKFLLQFTDIFMILLMIAAGFIFVTYGIDPLHDINNLYIACLLLVVVIATCIFSYLQERQSSKVSESFGKLMATFATVIRDGKKVEVRAEEVVTGDLLALRAGEKCAADIRLLVSDGLRTDNSSMTGESEPVSNTVNKTADVAVHSRNMVWSGSLVVDGGGIGIVVAIGDNTLIGRVARLASDTKEVKSILAKEILRFVFISSVMSVILAVIIGAIGGGRKFKTITVIIATISMILANVPQGLPPAVRTILALTAKSLQKRNMFVKQLDIVETLGSCSVIASDKTGTLTQNKMTAIHTWPSRGPKEVVSDDAIEADAPGSLEALEKVLILCNRITVDRSVKVLAPDMDFAADASEIGLFKRAFQVPAFHDIRDRYPKVAEVPFNSVHKWQLSVQALPEKEVKTTGMHYLLVLKGAPEIVCKLCTHYFTKDGKIEKSDQVFRDFVTAQITKFASMGERVLGFAQTFISESQRNYIDAERELPPGVELRFAGLQTLLDPPKAGVAEAVLSCISAGIKVIMVTGDFPVTAAAIAKQVNIFSDAGDPNDQVAYAGAEIESFSQEDWDRILSKQRLVFARMQPEHKLLIVEQLQRRGEVVAVTGDGVNDSPALKRADVGIAMGIAGTEVAKEAAKIICMDDNFATIVEGIRQGRVIFDNLRKTIMLVVTHLIPEAWPFVFTFVLDMPLGLSSLLLLTIDLAVEMAPSVCIAYEGPEADVMSLPPRNLKKDRLVTFPTLSHAYLEIGMIETLICLAMYFHLLNVTYKVPLKTIGNSIEYFASGSPDLVRTDGEVWTDSQQVHILKEVQTLWFVTIGSCQIGHALAIRGARQAAWKLERNMNLYFACIISILVMVIVTYTPGVKTFLLSRPFPPGYWIGAAISALVIFIIVETKKAALRTFSAPRKQNTKGIAAV